MHDSLRLEKLQNRAARLVTGTPFRTSTERLRLDLGWDALTVRRELHRLQMYFKLQNDTNNILPDYVVTAMPNTRLQDTQRNLRNAASQSLPPNHTSLFQRSFIPTTTRDWNKLPGTIRTNISPKTFKRELFKRLCIPEPPVYYSLGSKKGNILHTKLRLGMSDLNAHLYSIQKSETPLCSCSNIIETTNHFIIHCTLYAQQRNTLNDTLSSILQLNFSLLSPEKRTNILLHGTNLSTGERHRVARAFHTFLFDSKRFRF